MTIQKNTMKAALAATLMGSLLLVACGGSDDNSTSTATASSSNASSSVTSSAAASSSVTSSAAASSSVTSSAATSSAAASSAVASSEASSSAAASSAVAVTKTWGFDQATFSAAGTTLFTAAFSATADNAVKQLVTTNAEVLAGTGEVTVDGIKFNNSSTSAVIRYRPTGMSSNGSGSDWLNTNGAFFSDNATTIPAANSTLPTNVRAYFGVPVSTGSVFTVSVTYRQTSATATAGKLALVCNTDSKVLAVADVSTTAGAYDADKTLTYTAPDSSHGCTVIRAIYGREGLSTGGVNVKQIVRTQ